MARSKSRPTRRRRGVRIIRGIALLIVLLIAGSLAYQALAEARDRRAYPPPGRLVDVGGYRLHINVAGEGRAGPTILLAHGAGSMSAQWGWIQPEVAQFARVVSYDPPGLGYSDSPPRSLTATEMLDDLHEGLTSLGIRGPFIVVGHSMGGIRHLPSRNDTRTRLRVSSWWMRSRPTTPPLRAMSCDCR